MNAKNIFIVPVLFVLIATGTQAQENRTGNNDYNQWYIEGGVGFHRPYNYFTQGYYTATPDFFVGELGTRYMINEFFGMKLGLMYDRFSNHDYSRGTFVTNQYGMGIQGVVNIGRLLRFQEWTNTFNVLAHYGLGVSFLSYENTSWNDWVGNSLGGLTLQTKVSPRVTLYGEIAGINNFRQDRAFDGGSPNHGNLPVIFRGTFGISVSIGSNRETLHADYYVRTPYETAMYNTLESRVTEVESSIESIDSGYEELNRRMDEMDRKVDDLQDEVSSISSTQVVDVNAMIAQLITDGYFNIYFDFDSDLFGKIAAPTINALKTYMDNNPEATLELAGYADERGPADYNQRLSQRRADAIAKALVNVGIDSSRIIAVGKGEDLSLDSTAREVYQQARRVTVSLR